MFSVDDYLNSDASAVILEKSRNKKEAWKNSPFKEFYDLVGKTKGAIGELLYEEYVTKKGCHVKRSLSPEFDRVVDGRKKEIKLSFQWKGKAGSFRWQQIRPIHQWDDIVFIAIYPNRIEFYEADKETILEHVIIENDKGEWVNNQHGGRKVNSGTFWITGTPQDFPWMKPITEG